MDTALLVRRRFRISSRPKYATIRSTMSSGQAARVEFMVPDLPHVLFQV